MRPAATAVSSGAGARAGTVTANGAQTLPKKVESVVQLERPARPDIRTVNTQNLARAVTNHNQWLMELKPTKEATYEERVLGSKILKICKARWTPEEARTDEVIPYEMYFDADHSLRRSKTPKVLIVLDNRWQAAGLAVMLRRLGCTCIVCSDGDLAFTKYLKRGSDDFNMCICDWERPSGIGGRELCIYDRDAGGTLPFLAAVPIHKSANDIRKSGATIVLRAPLAVHILTLKELLLPHADRFSYPAELLSTPSNHLSLAKVLLTIGKDRDYEAERMLQQAIEHLEQDQELSSFDRGMKMLEQVLAMVRNRSVGSGETGGGAVGVGGGVPLEDYQNLAKAFKAAMVTFSMMKDDVYAKTEEVRLFREYRRRKEGGILTQHSPPTSTTAVLSDSSFRGGGNSMSEPPLSSTLVGKGDTALSRQPSFSNTTPQASSLNPKKLTQEYMDRHVETSGNFQAHAYIDVDALSKKDTTTLIKKFRGRISDLEMENELLIKELERFAYFKVEVEDNISSNGIAVRFEERSNISKNKESNKENVAPGSLVSRGSIYNAASSPGRQALGRTASGISFGRMEDTDEEAASGSDLDDNAPFGEFKDVSVFSPARKKNKKGARKQSLASNQINAFKSKVGTDKSERVKAITRQSIANVSLLKKKVIGGKVRAVAAFSRTGSGRDMRLGAYGKHEPLKDLFHTYHEGVYRNYEEYARRLEEKLMMAEDTRATQSQTSRRVTQIPVPEKFHGETDPKNPNPVQALQSQVSGFMTHVCNDVNRVAGRIMAVNPGMHAVLEDLSLSIRNAMKRVDLAKAYADIGAFVKKQAATETASLQEQIQFLKSAAEMQKSKNPDVEARKKLVSLRQSFFLFQQRAARTLHNRTNLFTIMRWYFRWMTQLSDRKGNKSEQFIRNAVKREIFENKGTFIGQLSTELEQNKAQVAGLMRLLQQEKAMRVTLEEHHTKLQQQHELFKKASANPKGSFRVRESSDSRESASSPLLNHNDDVKAMYATGAVVRKPSNLPSSVLEVSKTSDSPRSPRSPSGRNPSASLGNAKMATSASLSLSRSGQQRSTGSKSPTTTAKKQPSGSTSSLGNARGTSVSSFTKDKPTPTTRSNIGSAKMSAISPRVSRRASVAEVSPSLPPNRSSRRASISASQIANDERRHSTTSTRSSIVQGSDPSGDAATSSSLDLVAPRSTSQRNSLTVFQPNVPSPSASQNERPVEALASSTGSPELEAPDDNEDYVPLLKTLPNDDADQETATQEEDISAGGSSTSTPAKGSKDGKPMGSVDFDHSGSLNLPSPPVVRKDTMANKQEQGAKAPEAISVVIATHTVPVNDGGDNTDTNSSPLASNPTTASGDAGRLNHVGSFKESIVVEDGEASSTPPLNPAAADDTKPGPQNPLEQGTKRDCERDEGGNDHSPPPSTVREEHCGDGSSATTTMPMPMPPTDGQLPIRRKKVQLTEPDNNGGGRPVSVDVPDFDEDDDDDDDDEYKSPTPTKLGAVGLNKPTPRGAATVVVPTVDKCLADSTVMVPDGRRSSSLHSSMRTNTEGSHDHLSSHSTPVLQAPKRQSAAGGSQQANSFLGVSPPMAPGAWAEALATHLSPRASVVLLDESSGPLDATPLEEDDSEDAGGDAFGEEGPSVTVRVGGGISTEEEEEEGRDSPSDLNGRSGGNPLEETELADFGDDNPEGDQQHDCPLVAPHNTSNQDVAVISASSLPLLSDNANSGERPLIAVEEMQPIHQPPKHRTRPPLPAALLPETFRTSKTPNTADDVNSGMAVVGEVLSAARQKASASVSPAERRLKSREIACQTVVSYRPPRRSKETPTDSGPAESTLPVHPPAAQPQISSKQPATAVVTAPAGAKAGFRSEGGFDTVPAKHQSTGPSQPSTFAFDELSLLTKPGDLAGRKPSKHSAVVSRTSSTRKSDRSIQQENDAATDEGGFYVPDDDEQPSGRRTAPPQQVLDDAAVRYKQRRSESNLVSPQRGVSGAAAATADFIREVVSGTALRSLHQPQPSASATRPSPRAIAQSRPPPIPGERFMSPSAHGNLGVAADKAVRSIQHSLSRLKQSSGVEVPINVRLLRDLLEKAHQQSGAATTPEQRASYQLLTEMQRALHIAAVAASRGSQHRGYGSAMRQATPPTAANADPRRFSLSAAGSVNSVGKEILENAVPETELYRYQLDPHYVATMDPQSPYFRHSGTSPDRTGRPVASRRSVVGGGVPLASSVPALPIYGNSFFIHSLNRPTKMQLALQSYHIPTVSDDERSSRVRLSPSQPSGTITVNSGINRSTSRRSPGSISPSQSDQAHLQRKRRYTPPRHVYPGLLPDMQMSYHMNKAATEPSPRPAPPTQPQHTGVWQGSTDGTGTGQANVMAPLMVAPTTPRLPKGHPTATYLRARPAQPELIISSTERNVQRILQAQKQRGMLTSSAQQPVQEGDPPTLPTIQQRAVVASLSSGPTPRSVVPTTPRLPQLASSARPVPSQTPRTLAERKAFTARSLESFKHLAN